MRNMAVYLPDKDREGMFEYRITYVDTRGRRRQSDLTAEDEISNVFEAELLLYSRGVDVDYVVSTEPRKVEQ